MPPRAAPTPPVGYLPQSILQTHPPRLTTPRSENTTLASTDFLDPQALNSLVGSLTSSNAQPFPSKTSILQPNHREIDWDMTGRFTDGFRILGSNISISDGQSLWVNNPSFKAMHDLYECSVVSDYASHFLQAPSIAALQWVQSIAVAISRDGAIDPITRKKLWKLGDASRNAMAQYRILYGEPRASYDVQRPTWFQDKLRESVGPVSGVGSSEQEYAEFEADVIKTGCHKLLNAWSQAGQSSLRQTQNASDLP